MFHSHPNFTHREASRKIRKLALSEKKLSLKTFTTSDFLQLGDDDTDEEEAYENPMFNQVDSAGLINYQRHT